MTNYTCSFSGEYCNPSFPEVFNSPASFLEGYHNCGIPTTITDESATTLFYLIYAKYGNTPIRSNDPNLFAYRVFQIIFQYAPTWEKRLAIQEKLRGMNLDTGELYEGGKAIYNHASHDGSIPPQIPTELSYIDSQNTTNHNRSKTEGLALLTTLLEKDVTEELLGRFDKLFSKWLMPDIIPYFVTEVE